MPVVINSDGISVSFATKLVFLQHSYCLQNVLKVLVTLAPLS
jgi:hypothetical protein